jgi:hypothetical protein
LGAVRWIWIGAVVAAAAAVAVVLVVAHGGGSSGTAAASAQSVTARLDRTTVDFADPLTASVTVTAPRGATVRVDPGLAPLTRLGRTQVTRIGRTATYTVRASCLDDRCIARRGSKRITPQAAVVSVDGSTSTARWPAVVVEPRVAPADVQKLRPPLRSDASPPPVTYSTSPSRLATVLDVVAALLAVAGVLLAAATAVWLLRRRHAPPPLAGLERALALAREAEDRPAADRRRALGLLSDVLGSRDERLADEAEELAWSAPAPTPVALSELVTEVEQKVNGA